MATIKFKGTRIVPVKVTRYEVRDPTGKVMHKAGTASACKQWVTGYLTALDKAAKEVAAQPPKTPKRRAKKTVAEVAAV